jgi:hypothetical protein
MQYGRQAAQRRLLLRWAEQKLAGKSFDVLLGVTMKKWFVFLAAITFLISTCFAQERPVAKKEPQTKSNQTKVRPAPVAEAKQIPKKRTIIKFSMGMLESERIDLGYTGSPAEDVITAIERLTGSKKGEFESTTVYEARKAAALKAKFLDDSSVEDIFAFAVPVQKIGNYGDGLSGLRYEFNADTGEVNLYVLPKSSQYHPLNWIDVPGYERPSKGLDQFTLSTKKEAQKTYQGSNAYGATITVEQTSMSSAGIAVNRIPFLKFERDSYYGNPPVANQFKLENSLAAAELPALKALMVVKLTDPYVVYQFVHKEPKRDSPTDISGQERYLTGDMLGIVFYSGRTGEIVARLPETFGKPKVAAPEDKQASQ